MSTLRSLARKTAITAIVSVSAAFPTLSYAAPVELILGNGSTPAVLQGAAGVTVNDYTVGSVASFVFSTTLAPAFTAVPSNGSYDYDFTFSLNSHTSTLLVGGITTNLNLNGGLVDDVSNGHGGYTIGSSPITPSNVYTSIDPSQPTVVIFSGLAAGTYTLELYGALNAGTSLGSFTGFVEAVPLPAALPMFAAGLIGLAGLGLRRSRRSRAV